MQAFDIAIDVGDAQPHIDWPAVAAAGIRIVMIKCTEGATFVSPTFAAQWKGALDARLKPIPYHFLRPGSADAQVQRFRNVAALAKNQPYALDWEGRASQTCTPQVAEAIGTQLAVITGRLPLGYWGIHGSTPALPTAAMLTWDRWVPRYPQQGAETVAMLRESAMNKRPPEALWWQYTCWGRVPGIKGPVDRSAIFAESLESALAWYGTGKLG